MGTPWRRRSRSVESRAAPVGSRRMNLSAAGVDAADPRRLALVELARDGGRREWSFGEVAARSAQLAGTLAANGIGRGDVGMTLIGNRPDWVFTMVACLRIGAITLPCTEQLRAHDLRLRLDVAQPALILHPPRNREHLVAARPAAPVTSLPD